MNENKQTQIRRSDKEMDREVQEQGSQLTLTYVFIKKEKLKKLKLQRELYKEEKKILREKNERLNKQLASLIGEMQTEVANKQITGDAMEVMEEEGSEGENKNLVEEDNECKKKEGSAEEHDEREEPESGGGGEEEETNDTEDDDNRNCIRIRSQDDGIFEQEDDEDDDDEEFLNYAIPQVELQEHPVSGVRKRKQEISVLARDDLDDMVEVSDDEFVDHYYSTDQFVNVDPGMFRKKSKEQRVSPLYMLNPDDYAHDQKKQIQIRRAIITYRHHREKKETILHQQEEIKNLRSHNEALKAKVMELSGCGCPKNRTANVDVVDVIIPPTPMKLYAKGNNRSCLGTSLQSTPTTSSMKTSEKTGTECDSTQKLAKINLKEVKEEPKPLVNITTSLLANLNSKTMATATSRPLPIPPAAKVLSNGTALSKISTYKQFGPSPRFLKLNGLKPSAPPGSLAMLSSLKSDPGGSISSTSTGNRTTPSVPLCFSTIKKEPSTPATATPVSRIVFAKKGVNTSNAVQTASQLVFGTAAIQTGANHGQNVKTHTPSSPLTASQLALASRVQFPGVANSFKSINMRSVSQHPQIFRTPSGQVLKLVQPANVARQMSTSMGRVVHLPQYQSIKPKPIPSMSQQDAEALQRQIERKQLEDMWKELDDNDEEEIAIISAIDGDHAISPIQQRNRKQTMKKRPNGSSDPGRVIKSGGEEIELNRYADIVFEEAD